MGSLPLLPSIVPALTLKHRAARRPLHALGRDRRCALRSTGQRRICNSSIQRRSYYTESTIQPRHSLAAPVGLLQRVTLVPVPSTRPPVLVGHHLPPHNSTAHKAPGLQPSEHEATKEHHQLSRSQGCCCEHQS